MLEIRRGRTSVAPLETPFFGPVPKEQLARKQPAEGFTMKLDDEINAGYYVRLVGKLDTFDGLLITYAQFYRWANAMCSDPDDMHCANGRCVESKARCKNFLIIFFWFF